MAKGEEHTPVTEVIIAAVNEEQGIGPTISEIKDVLGDVHFLVVDGKSTDQTVRVARCFNVDVVVQDHSGKGDALAKAVKYANLEADYVVITDADYTYPAKYLPSMIQLLEENPTIGMICGNRFGSKIEKNVMPDAFYLGNRLIAFTHNFLNGVPLQDPLTGLRVIRAKILKNWVVKSKGFDIEVELNHRVEREGYGILEIPITYRQRLGEKKLRVRHGAEIIKRILLETTY